MPMSIGTIDRVPRLTLSLGRIGMPSVTLSIDIRVSIDLLSRTVSIE